MSKKIDLTLLKSLTSEVEKGIAKIEVLENDEKLTSEYSIEMFKLAGLFLGLSQESQGLLADTYKAYEVAVKSRMKKQEEKSAAPQSADDLITQLFGKQSKKNIS